jgi:hypothetical protein
MSNKLYSEAISLVRESVSEIVPDEVEVEVFFAEERDDIVCIVMRHAGEELGYSISCDQILYQNLSKEMIDGAISNMIHALLEETE